MMVAALAGVLGMAANARAQTWTVIPSLSVGATYDDNLFFDADRLGGVGLRGGPALSVACQPTARFKLLGRVGLDSEYFGDPKTSSWAARRNAGLSASYQLGEFTTATLSGDYALSAYAAELIPSVGVEFGRRAADSFGSRLELEHRVSSNIVLRAGYGVQSLELERSGRGLRSQLSSDADLVFRVAPHTTLRMQVGPRYIEGSFSAHVAGSLERTRPRTRLSIGYERGRNLAFDRTLVVESYAAGFSYRLLPALDVSVSPAMFRQWEFARERRSWHVGGSASYRVRSWLAAFVSHAYVLEDRGLFVDPLTLRRQPSRLWRNTLTAGFTLVPYHVREESKQ